MFVVSANQRRHTEAAPSNDGSDHAPHVPANPLPPVTMKQY